MKFHPQWSDAKWNISGMFNHFENLVKFMKVVTSFSNNPIQAVHDCYDMPWNSGRLSDKVLSAQEIKQIITSFRMQSIRPCATFSNPDIDITDRSGNYILKILNECHGGVIISNEELNQYVKQRFSNIQRKASILKLVHENVKGDLEKYKELSVRYDVVMVHVDDSIDIEFMSKLANESDVSKYEVLVNENCVVNCPFRKEHYEKISTCSKLRDPISLSLLDHFKATKCEINGQLKQLQKRTLNLTTDELRRIYELGFRQFKIQGRFGSWNSLLHDLCKYIFEPQHTSDQVYKFLSE